MFLDFPCGDFTGNVQKCLNECTVGTKIIVDPEKCFQEFISEKLLILLRDGPCLELIIVSSNFQASFF